MALTGIKDVDEKILNILDDKELGRVCQTNKKAKTLCDDEDFWRRRTESRFGKYLLPLGIDVRDYKVRSWKEYYIHLRNVVDAAKLNWEIGGGDENILPLTWEKFKASRNDIWIGGVQYPKKHALSFRELENEDEKALAVQVAILNHVEDYKDISQLPLDHPLFNSEIFYSSFNMDQIIKKKNLIQIEKIKDIFRRIDPNTVLIRNNFFKKKRLPFLQIILEDPRLNEEGILISLTHFKIKNKKIEQLVMNKLKQLGSTKKSIKKFGNKVLFKNIGHYFD